MEPHGPATTAVEQLAEGELAILEEPHAPPHIPGRERSEIAARVILYALLGIFSVLYFVPFVWSILTSLKTLPETTGLSWDTLFPDDPSLHAYRRVLTQFDFARYTLNSFLYASAVTLFNLVLASLGGYAFARLRFPGRELLFLLVLGTLMIPDELRLVPVFQMLSNLGTDLIGRPFLGSSGFLEGYTGLVLINLVMATNLFFMRQYFLTIPKDFEEAAKLDKAGYFKTYWKVMLPLAGPALAAITILTFQGMWNGFFWPLIILGFGSPEIYTVPLGIAQFRFQYQTLWPELMAAAILATIPVTIIYIFFQRYFVAGVVASGVKG